jgi:hypothetical protein
VINIASLSLYRLNGINNHRLIIANQQVQQVQPGYPGLQYCYLSLVKLAPEELSDAKAYAIIAENRIS